MKKSGRNIHRFNHTAMGTVFETVVAGTDQAYARQASQAFFSEIDRFERLLSRFDPCSEIGQINLLEAGQSLSVNADVYECLARALDLQKKTGGAFDINYRILQKKSELSRPVRFKSIPDSAPAAVELSRCPEGFRIFYPAGTGAAPPRGLDLDLGGIGKGYALEKAAAVFSDWSLEHVLMHAGTSTAFALGSARGSEEPPPGWPVGAGGNWPCLENKRFNLSNRALSGSGTDIKGEHIFDSRRGKEASGHLAAWVSHPSAAEADALSTAFLVMHTDEVASFCKRNPETWALVLIDPQHFEVYNENVLEELPL